MGDGRLAPALARHWPEPLVLWATPERPGADRVTACALVGQHLFASLLRQLRHPFEIVYGSPADAPTGASLRDAARLIYSAASLARARVGLVGSHAPGFSNLHVDPARLAQALGAQLVQLGLHEFIDSVRSFDAARVRDETARIRALQLPADDGIGGAELDLDARYGLALEALMHTHGLAALALRCWPELPDVLGQWPYLALARLASAHVAIALEGDADGALCSLLSERLGLGPSFITDWLAHDEHRITVWHPGMAPFQLCPAPGSPGGPRLSYHFNNRKPLCVDAELRAETDVTLFRLWSCDGRYHLTAAEGRTGRADPPLAGNSARVHLARSAPRWFDDLCHAGMPHHLSVVAGAHADTLRRFARLAGISFSPECSTP
jgi:L-fucose isomerase-like protein